MRSYRVAGRPRAGRVSAQRRNRFFKLNSKITHNALGKLDPNLNQVEVEEVC